MDNIKAFKNAPKQEILSRRSFKALWEQQLCDLPSVIMDYAIGLGVEEPVFVDQSYKAS